MGVELTEITSMATATITKPRVGEEYELTRGVQKILRSCGEMDGLWYCLSHRTSCATENAKTVHLMLDHYHKMAWLCYVHGLERP